MEVSRETHPNSHDPWPVPSRHSRRCKGAADAARLARSATYAGLAATGVLRLGGSKLDLQRVTAQHGLYPHWKGVVMSRTYTVTTVGQMEVGDTFTISGLGDHDWHGLQVEPYQHPPNAVERFAMAQVWRWPVGTGA